MYRLLSMGLLVLLALSAQGAQANNLAQTPLYLTQSVDPNVLLNLSVETPMGGAAYNDQKGTMPNGTQCSGRNGGKGTCYFPAETYLGYFDPQKCYSYNNSQGYFEPEKAANTDHSCTGGYFSGNMMNWASMTAMDMLIMTMTGGNRVVDEVASDNAVTVIERVRKQNNNSWFPWKYFRATANYPDYNVPTNTVTPWTESGAVYVYNTDFGIEFYKNAANRENSSNRLGAYNLRVRVCDKEVGLEANCVAYAGGAYYKPEGLMQKNAQSMRFAVTSFSKDGSRKRDGGVLRANMKYVGPYLPDGMGNANAEYGSDGAYITDPDKLLAQHSYANYSGVMNYLNRFSRDGYKGIDPASELYYESIRYLKGLTPTPEYSSGLSDTQKTGFPVMNDWQDPITQSCQKSFIVGINDANPHVDKSLPGTRFINATYKRNDGKSYTLKGDDYGEPSNADPEINVSKWTDLVGEVEGLNGSSFKVGCVLGGDCDMSNSKKYVDKLSKAFGTYPAPSKENSYYIAGLAYYANTADIRTGIPGKQTINTFMIDTQEYSKNPLTGNTNMLWLAGKYGGFIDKNGNGKPDLQEEWDADGDGQPDNYVYANQPQKLVAGLNRAFDDIVERSSSSSSAVVNSARLSDDSKVFQARFNSGDWGGALLAYPLDRQGNIGELAWNAAEGIPPASSRTVLSWNEQGIAFSWSNLSEEQQAALNSTDGLGQQRLAYLRGDQRREANGDFRPRSSRLGDIVNSDPVYTANEDYHYHGMEVSYRHDNADSYWYYLNQYKRQRPAMIYAGANDGMLHGFRAQDSSQSCIAPGPGCAGEELLGYIPRAVYANLAELSDPDYKHRYFVDGQIRVADAYIDYDGAGERWGTALVGTLGTGGQGVFALDITDPENFTARDVLWDITSADDGFADLGYTFGRPVVVKLANGDGGQWVAIINNGYASASGKAVLYIVDLYTGSLLHTFDTGVGDAGTPNGMSSPVAIDTNDDRLADRIYAGDLQGNLWRIDFAGKKNQSGWDFAFKKGNGKNATPKPLFRACADSACNQPQPITVQPKVLYHPDNTANYMLLFGTGKYFASGDGADLSSLQSVYGIRDKGEQIATDRSSLKAQKIIHEGQIPDGRPIRVTSQYSLDYSRWDGWYMDFADPLDSTNTRGERVVEDPIVRGGNRLVYQTLLPSADPCAFGGTSWTMEVDAFTGARLDYTPFDYNDDGVFSEADYVLVDINNTPDNPDDDIKTPGSGIQLGNGINRGVAVVEKADGNEVKISSGSTGEISSVLENTGEEVGRQSWIQLR